MKNKKMVLWLVLIVISVISIYAQQYDSEKDFEIAWDSEVEGGVIIIKYLGAKKEISIPPKIQNYPVTGIGEFAFYDNKSITKVTIPDSVTYFYWETFKDCTSLTAINVDARNNSFCSVDGIIYSKDRTILIRYPGGKPGAFTIPNSVTRIGGMAFTNCIGLTGITIPDSVTDMGKGTFYGCNKLVKVTIGNGITSFDDSVFDTPYGAFSDCVSLTSINIPNSVIKIGDIAFKGCTSLTSITIPKSVTSIEDSAFKDCTSLSNITIPDSIISIGNDAFLNTAWFNKQPDGVVYVGKFVYKYKGTMPANTSITLINGTKGFANQAFLSCTGLTSVTIPYSVTSIGREAFRGCTGLTSVTIGSSVTSIGVHAFSECTKLTSITIPKSVTSIGEFAFYRSKSLTSVTFATGSNISDANFGRNAFPEGSSGVPGNSLKTAYSTGKAGTYTRTENGSTWTKQTVTTGNTGPLRQTPRTAQEFTNRGNAYFKGEDYDAVKINPYDAICYYSLGSAYYIKGDYSRAITNYEAALKIDPNDANAKKYLEESRKLRGY